MVELDEALGRFQLGGLEYAGGLANHGPMAAEAMVALGHPALVESFVDVYAPRLPPCEIGKPLAPREQSAALGDPGRAADWLATFLSAVEAEGWQAVAQTWLPRLLSGVFAAAGHGFLRFAHAVRALSREETPVRERELAFGLAHWATRFQRLPGSPGAAVERGRSACSVLAELTPVAPSARRPGLFMHSVLALDEHATFREELSAFDPMAQAPGDALAGLCREAAALYLANRGSRIAYVHTVTLPAALRMVLPLIGERDARDAVGFVLQAVAALHAVSASERVSAEADALPADAPSSPGALASDTAELRYRAACSIEEHVIKMVEACLRENADEPSELLCLAAADAALHLGPREAKRVC